MGFGNQIFGGYSKADVDENIKRLKDEKKEVLIELRSAQEKVGALEKLLAETQKIVNALQEEIEENKALFNKEENKLSSFDKKNLLFDYRNLIIKAKNLVNTEKKLTSRNRELEEENFELKNQLHLLSTEVDTKKELEAFLGSLGSLVFAEEEARAQDDLNQLAAKLKERIDSSVEVSKEKERLVKLVEKLERDLEGTKASNKDVTDQYHSLSNELTGVLLKNKEFINKIEELQLEVNTLESIKGKLENNRNILNKEIEQYKVKAASDEAAIIGLKNRLNALEEENQMLEAEIGEAKEYKIKIGDVFQKVVNISATIEERVEEEAKRLIKERVEEFFSSKNFVAQLESGKEEEIIVEETIALSEIEEQ